MKKQKTALNESLENELNNFMSFAGSLFSEKSIRTEVKKVLLKVLKDMQNYDNVVADEDDETDMASIEILVDIPSYFRDNQKEQYLRIFDAELKKLFKNTNIEADTYIDKNPKDITIYLEFKTIEVQSQFEKRVLSNLDNSSKETRKTLKL